jgi:tetratricopeptide (TPR) repeat protein
MRIIAGVVLGVLCAMPLPACINTYNTTLQGKRVPTGGMPGPSIVQLTEMEATARKGLWEEMRRNNASGGDHRSRTDYAAALLHLGEVQPAIAILEAVEKERPGLYITASNLGTAYELAGDNAKARHWIAEGVRRNAESHEGTEWVHLTILDAKLAQAADARWLDTHSVMQLDFGSEAVPRRPKGFDAKKVSEAARYQLGERLQFVKAPDAYVADVFFDWGNAEALGGSLENAVELYEQALKFGSKREPLVRMRLAHAKKVIKRAK